jgi:hypothetical protein
MRNIEELEQAWLTHLRNTKRQPTQLASLTPNGDRFRPVLTRQTLPPVQPFDDVPPAVVRGVAPEADRDYPGKVKPVSRPGYLPDFIQPSRLGSSDGWQVPPGSSPPTVTLGPPQFDSQPPARLGRPVPAGTNPVGYPQ